MRLALTLVLLVTLVGTAFLLEIPDLLILANRHRTTIATISSNAKVSMVEFTFNGTRYSRHLPPQQGSEAQVYFDPQKPARLTMDPPALALKRTLPAWGGLFLLFGVPLAWLTRRLLRPRNDCCA